MTSLLTNVTLRANRLPTLTPDQWELLTSDDALARQFSSSLDALECERLEESGCQSYDLECGRAQFRSTLQAIIAELSLRRPAAHPEVAARQARLRSMTED